MPDEVFPRRITWWQLVLALAVVAVFLAVIKDYLW